MSQKKKPSYTNLDERSKNRKIRWNKKKQDGTENDYD